jgi:hypothetical protein
MANNLVALMQYIANAALIIAAGLFTFEILRMTIEYMITHEAKKLTQSMVRKLFLFLIVSAFVSHIQSIMSFLFTSFVNLGIGLGGQAATGGVGTASPDLDNPLYSWGMLGLMWSSSMNLLSSLDTNWMNVVRGIPDVFLIYAILLIISLLIIFIIIQFFLIQLEIIIQMSIGSIAIAFSMLSYTQDITKNYIKSLLNMGIRLFTIIIVIYFFNYVVLYDTEVLAQLAPTGVIEQSLHPFQTIQNALLSILFLSILIAFFVAKAPGLVANAMSGSGSGSGLDAAIMMGAAADAAFKTTQGAVGMAKGGAKAAPGVAGAVWNAPAAIMDAPGNIKNSVAGSADKFKEDWNKRLHKNQVNKNDFVPPEPPKDNLTN